MPIHISLYWCYDHTCTCDTQIYIVHNGQQVKTTTKHGYIYRERETERDRDRDRERVYPEAYLEISKVFLM